MVSEIQWKPFWLATQLYPHNDCTGWQNGVNDDVCTPASLTEFNSIRSRCYLSDRTWTSRCHLFQKSFHLILERHEYDKKIASWPYHTLYNTWWLFPLFCYTVSIHWLRIFRLSVISFKSSRLWEQILHRFNLRLATVDWKCHAMAFLRYFSGLNKHTTPFILVFLVRSLIVRQTYPTSLSLYLSLRLYITNIQLRNDSHSNKARIISVILDPDLECHLLTFNWLLVVFCHILSTTGE